MCGLYGCLTKLGADSLLTDTQKRQKSALISSLMVANEQRGQDSTGIGCISNEGKWRYLKQAISASRFVGTTDLRKELAKNPQVLVGHTRFATTGTVNANNAHPFKYGSIMGAHNGVVSNYLEIDNTVNVDSEVIFRLLSRNNNNYQKVFKRLSGNFAISWVDLKNPGGVYLVRHDNPLFVAVVPKLKTIFWSSVVYSLETAITGVLGSKAKYQVFELEANKVFYIDKKTQITKHDVEFKTFYSSYSDYNKKHFSEDSDNDAGFSAQEIAEEYGCEYCGNEPETGFYYSPKLKMVACVYHAKDLEEATDDSKWVGMVSHEAKKLGY